MLELKNITKIYPAGSGTIQALKGIDIKFRENEFVSILGPSGCGKTTMLNIIGGLDQYTEGDLVINGKSTKSFKDREWDTYRNHSVGFVFQSYNLIPHQTVLQNVELALTLSGVSKSERKKRAKKALEEVGLSDQASKRPGEMSGGQMQRVAIARALVNNPDIILADEPTGALDTETSVQVMDILKEVAKDRLVVMVTHNPELAEKYSTRIIRMLDGKVLGDSMPLSEEETKKETEKAIEKRKLDEQKKKPSMSIFTSFGLSLKNLFTKKGRTALTSFAGSIGIIGIALIFSVSQGMTTYIDILQEDTLSSYPLTLEAKHMDLSTLIQTFIGVAEKSNEHEKDGVYQRAAFYNLINALNNLEASENDLASFKKYIETNLNSEEDNKLKTALSGVQYSYPLDLKVYIEGVDGAIIHSDTNELLRELIMERMGTSFQSMTETAATSGGSNTQMMSMMNGSNGAGVSLWQEMLMGEDGELVNPLLKKQYDIIDEGGRWPEAYNEIVLVLDENNELDDMSLYALGLKSKDDIIKVMEAAMSKKDIDIDTKHWTYDEIKAMDFRVILNSSVFQLDTNTGLFTDKSETEAGLRYYFNNGIPLKVVGIVRPNEDAVSTMLKGSIAYTHALTEYVIKQSSEADAVIKQKERPVVDIFTGLPFKDSKGSISDEEKEAQFRLYIDNSTEADRAQIYMRIVSIPDEQFLAQSLDQTMASMTPEVMRQQLANGIKAQMGMSDEEIAQYLGAMSDEDVAKLIRSSVEEQIKANYAKQAVMGLSQYTTEQLAAILVSQSVNYTTEQCALYYDEVLDFSTSSYEKNLHLLGCIDLDTPTAINLFASTFASKDTIEEAIADYNADKDDLEKITYTDYIGLILSSITSVINAITYVLIAFVAISLVVSSIMIGVITLISVQERTKEIGILRAIGASKRDVSGLFNAETLIIGFTSGILGVGITYLLCIPINIIIHYLTGIYNLSAYLPPHVAGILVVISMLLTLFSGIIPSKSAAKKDPVVALRSE